jgi:hypothetical protein
LRCVARSSLRSPRAAPINSETSASISSWATARTDSRITSPCSSRSTRRTTSSIVILSAPAIAGLLPSNREKSDDHERRGGRTYIADNVIPSDAVLHQP